MSVGNEHHAIEFPCICLVHDHSVAIVWLFLYMSAGWCTMYVRAFSIEHHQPCMKTLFAHTSPQNLNTHTNNIHATTTTHTHTVHRMVCCAYSQPRHGALFIYPKCIALMLQTLFLLPRHRFPCPLRSAFNFFSGSTVRLCADLHVCNCMLVCERACSPIHVYNTRPSSPLL